MRITAVLPLYLPWSRAGAELMVHDILVECRERLSASIEVLLVTDLRSEGIANDLSATVDGVRVLTVDSAELNDRVSTHNPHVIVSQLGATTLAGAYALRTSTPLVTVVHDKSSRTLQQLSEFPPALTVFNTHWAHCDMGTMVGDSIVLHPAVRRPNGAPSTGISKPQQVTLVNLTREKGAHLFYALASALPHQEFLGVIGGYGKQVVRADLPNVTIQDHTDNMDRDVWSRTRILLVPSKYETYGMTAVEAAVRGIPVIAHRTRGLMEALGQHGRFVEDLSFAPWKNIIESTIADTSVSSECSAELPLFDADAELKATADAIARTGGPIGAQLGSAH